MWRRRKKNPDEGGIPVLLPFTKGFSIDVEEKKKESRRRRDPLLLTFFKSKKESRE